MKNIELIFALVICCLLIFSACKNGHAKSSNSSDSLNGQPMPRPSDNSDATNPSLADTAYPKKDTMVTHGDSVRSNK